MQQQKFLKRPADDHEGGPDQFEPPHKIQHNGSENLTKFSVEIVQQLEFTTSAANSHPQQISTNVTVKALTNASVKSDQQQQQAGNNGGAGANQQQQQQQQGSHHQQQQHNATPSPHMHPDLGNIVDFKQEPDNDFADLESCAAALEKDVAANGHFPGLSDLIGDDTNEANDTFKELISDLSDFHPELLNFEEKPMVEVKQEDGCGGGGGHHPNSQNLLDNLAIKTSNSPLTQYSSSPFSDSTNMKQPQRGPYNPNGPINELSPAAQTLKHMAEQHQHKNAMSMGYGRQQHPPQNNTRYADYNQFPGNEFMSSPNAGNQNPFHKGSAPPFPGADLIKQEMMGYSSPNDFDLKRLSQMTPNKIGPGAFPQPKQQQYSPYGSPGNISNHGSPGGNFMPNRGPGPQQNTGAPPRPPSGPGAGGQNTTTLQMKQTQQLHISQQGPGHGIQVSAPFFTSTL